MFHKQTVFTALLVTFCLLDIPAPSAGFGIFKGGGGGGGTSAVAEILAAGLITGILMDNSRENPMIMQALHHPFMMMHHHPMRHHMMHPIMHPYMMPTMHRPQYIMNHAMMAAHASHHRALTARLNEEIKALEAQESILEAYLVRSQQQQGSESAINQLLSEEDTIPSAALLVDTAELMERDGSMSKPLPDIYEAAGSEHESKYILPRIVRHFVQRLMRRGENH